MTEITLGDIRKRAEISLYRHLPFDITEEQVIKVRELAPLVAEGKMSLEAAVLEVEEKTDV